MLTSDEILNQITAKFYSQYSGLFDEILSTIFFGIKITCIIVGAGLLLMLIGTFNEGSFFDRFNSALFDEIIPSRRQARSEAEREEKLYEKYAEQRDRSARFAERYKRERK